MPAALLASIPSPSSSSVDLGPFSIHLYGLTLLVAIAVCTWITGRRWVARGGDWDLILRCAVWGVAAGIVGARAYHVVTSWDEVPDEWWGAFAIWKGGLGVWGGILAGCVVGGIIARRAGADVWLLADCLAPGLLVAQAIGRLGNWWNQELFGKPTDLPWGLEIAPEKRPITSLAEATYHPAFLYELLWNLLAAALLVFVLERRFRPRPPGVFAAYVALYCFGRFWIELLRVDPAHEIIGLRLNAWVAVLGVVVGVIWFVRSQRGGGGARRDRPRRRRLRRLRREPKPPKRPAMTVPKGRVRPGG
jgi:prolipoprotein diacylglyceryl transferase